MTGRTVRLARSALVGVAIVLAAAAVGVFMMGRPDIRTRRVRYNGELCTEYFDTKDGVEVRAMCPSRGGEWYVDTNRAIKYAPGFPVEYPTKPPR